MKVEMSSIMRSALLMGVIALVGCSSQDTTPRVISGSISGLEGSGLSLVLNDGVPLAVAAGASTFTFGTKVNQGSSYLVEVYANPTGPTQTCTVANGSGTVGGANVTDIAVTCATNTYSVGGVVRNLTGSGLALQLNGLYDLSVDAGATSFEFGTALPSGSTYSVEVSTQPTSPSQTCSLSSAAGTIVSADITGITVKCVTDSFTIQGTITGQVTADSAITVTLTDDDDSTVTDTTTASCTTDSDSGVSCSYSFSATDGVTYTVTPSASGLAFQPTSSTFTLDGANVTYDFVATCPSDYATCWSGCCAKAITISAGQYHTCAILYDGTAKCWGLNTDGQIGSGSNSPSWITTPTALSGSALYSAIAAGDYHTCAIVADAGSVACWGKNDTGQLGNNSTTSSYAPTAIVDAEASIYAAITSGRQHVCAITTSGGARCWGYNSMGELGNNTTDNALVPVDVSGSLTFTTLSAGWYHTCGITTSGGTIYCWGDNQGSALGVVASSIPYYSAVPVNPTLWSNSSSIAAGGRFSCSLLTDGGMAKCWGMNAYGQLGDGTTTDSQTAISVADGGYSYTAISTGGYHTCAILSDTGLVQCWGDNSYGQLGDGTTISHIQPAVISDTTTFSAISAGMDHTCGITTSGLVKCWGYNFRGQLGNGTSTDSTTPVEAHF